MKKQFLLTVVLFSTLLAGCDITLGFSTSKTENFTNKAENLVDEMEDALKEMKSLEEHELTNEDQQDIAEQLDSVLKKINDFQDEDAPFLGEKALKLALDKLQDKEELLIPLKEKAKNRSITKDDLDEIIEVLSPDFSFKIDLFN